MVSDTEKALNKMLLIILKLTRHANPSDRPEKKGLRRSQEAQKVGWTKEIEGISDH